MTRWMPAAALALLTTLATTPAQAGLLVYEATLRGAAESPPTASTGTGTVRLLIDDMERTMRVLVKFSGLTGLSTNAHIHCCTANSGLGGDAEASAAGNVGVATRTPSFLGFPSGVSSGDYDALFDMDLASSWNAAFLNNAVNAGNTATAFATLIAGMDAGKAYFNLHSQVFQGGEIRGFLLNVPEPGSAALAGLAIAGLLATRRRRPQTASSSARR